MVSDGTRKVLFVVLVVAGLVLVGIGFGYPFTVTGVGGLQGVSIAFPESLKADQVISVPITLPNNGLNWQIGVMLWTGDSLYSGVIPAHTVFYDVSSLGIVMPSQDVYLGLTFFTSTLDRSADWRIYGTETGWIILDGVKKYPLIYDTMTLYEMMLSSDRKTITIDVDYKIPDSYRSWLSIDELYWNFSAPNKGWYFLTLSNTIHFGRFIHTYPVTWEYNGGWALENQSLAGLKIGRLFFTPNDLQIASPSNPDVPVPPTIPSNVVQVDLVYSEIHKTQGLDIHLYELTGTTGISTIIAGIAVYPRKSF